MSGYTLTWKLPPSSAPGPAPAPAPAPGGVLAPGDGSFLRPDAAGLLEPAALAGLPVAVGRTKVPLAEFFDIEGQPGPVLRLRGLPPWDRLGAGMASGELFIHGDAGNDLGASMRGGRIHVHGNAGDRIGGPDYTSDRGMTGGEIVIDGDAGDYAGLRIRRGLIAIRGQAGASPGYRMLAGTLAVGRGPFDAPGLEMRRGTILALERPATSPAAPAELDGHLVTVGIFDATVSPMIRLVIRRLSESGWVVDPAAITGRYRLAVGDRFELGKGELWQWVG